MLQEQLLSLLKLQELFIHWTEEPSAKSLKDQPPRRDNFTRRWLTQSIFLLMLVQQKSKILFYFLDNNSMIFLSKKNMKLDNMLFNKVKPVTSSTLLLKESLLLKRKKPMMNSLKLFINTRRENILESFHYFMTLTDKPVLKL